MNLGIGESIESFTRIVRASCFLPNFYIWLFGCLTILNAASSHFHVRSAAETVKGYSLVKLPCYYSLTASFFMLLGAEFLAILVFIIYIGAISILFLFVIMLLNLRTIELYNTFFNYLPIGSFIGLLFFFEIFYIFSLDFTYETQSKFFDSGIFNF